MVVYVRDFHRRVPARAAVFRREGGDRVLEAFEGNDHRAVGLDDRLAAQAVRRVGGRKRRAPGQTAVGGRDHLFEVALAEVVELRVAVPEEGAGRRVVANRPVLVKVDLRRVRGGNSRYRITPCLGAVGRAAYQNRRHDPAGQQRYRGDEPDVVLGVEGHRWVAHSLIGTCGVDLESQAWKNAVGEVRPIVGRG